MLQQLLLIILTNLLTSSNCLSQEIGWFDDNDSAVGGFNHKIGHRCMIGEVPPQHYDLLVDLENPSYQ